MRKYKFHVAALTLGALISASVYFMTRPPAVGVALLSKSRHLSSLSKDYYYGYQWHPDGRMVREHFLKGGHREIYAVDPNSGAEQFLFRYAVKGNGYGSDDAGLLSPDGRWRITTMMKQFMVNSLDGSTQAVVEN